MLECHGDSFNKYPVSVVNDSYYTYMLSTGWSSWLFPLVLIPLHQLILRRCVCSLHARMLKCIGIGLLMHAVGYLLLKGTRVIISHDVHNYFTCAPGSTVWPDLHWYWKLGPCVVYGIGRTISGVLILEFIIAQSPDKMQGFVMGVMLGVRGLFILASGAFHWITFTICRDIIAVAALVVLFLVFLVFPSVTHYVRGTERSTYRP